MNFKYKPSPMRRLIFFKTFILLFMGENELSSLQWHFLSLIQQLFSFLSFLSCFNDFSPLKPIRKPCANKFLFFFLNSQFDVVLAKIRYCCRCWSYFRCSCRYIYFFSLFFLYLIRFLIQSVLLLYLLFRLINKTMKLKINSANDERKAKEKSNWCKQK